ncbi:two-component system phosphate regulon sensor histidine kinase PhoR [Chitinophaga skermanii]|uniref:histidine kinase n=1 Tax=Chitinophaga skermanii TaxID=331697 RepID=A0A327R1D4_9BACT|nr:HAMP domain-containing sensor histidine kinase [Chitinophaga skermanii]RAJ10686.1 two-component system phosphate regulon sensor histidine kinase PhoR [Chitinophaga skermanii]
MQRQFRIYISVTIFCFIALIAVQLFLLYNTYELLNERFYYDKKDKLNQLYGKAIANDVVYPGTHAIVDSILHPQFEKLSHLYYHNPQQYRVFSNQLIRIIFEEVNAHNTGHALIAELLQEAGIPDSLRFSFLIRRIDLTFDGKSYVPFYNASLKIPGIPQAVQHEKGLLFHPDNFELTNSNKISGVGISRPAPNSYAMNFQLHAQPYNKRFAILEQMRGTFTSTVVTLLALIVIFILTIRNWMRQIRLSNMKSDFINNVTHELNTPITSIIMASLHIQHANNEECPPKTVRMAQIIERQSERLRHLVTRVLEFTNVRLLPVKKEQLFLHTTVEEIIETYRLQLQASQQIIFQPSAEVILVEADPFHFTTLLQNLIDNAFKYNEREHKIVTISIGISTNNIQLTVTDNGIGMHKHTIQHVFDKYYRYQDHKSSPVKGLGIGLYFVKQCILAHHWQIEVKSVLDKGSRFIITIPIKA